MLHRDVRIEVVSQDKSSCRVELRSPPSIETLLTVRIHAAGIQTALEGVGAQHVRTEITETSTGTALHRIRTNALSAARRSMPQCVEERAPAPVDRDRSREHR